MFKKNSLIALLLLLSAMVFSQGVDFTTNIRVNCTDYSVHFNSSVTGYTSPTYLWTFGDGANSTDENPTHTYLGPGIYEVTLIVNNDAINSVKKNISVLTIPVATFTVDSTSANVSGSSFVFGFKSDFFILEHDTNDVNEEFFTLVSLYDDSEIEFPLNSYDFKWYFDDDSTSTKISPMHAYKEAGSYNVSLVIDDKVGCKDSVTYEDLSFGDYLSVYDAFLPAKVPNVFTPDGDGVNDIYYIKVDGVNSVYKFQVFAPTGILVYQSESRSVQWDGKNFAGEDVLPGTYFYVVEAVQGNTANKAHGVIYLFRNN